MLLLAALATACPKRAPQPSARGGSMIAHLTEERRSEVFELNLKKTERVLIEGNAGAGHEAPSLSLSLGGKVVNDDTMLGDAEGQSWLDVLAPEDGTYTLSVSFDTPESWGDVAVKVWNDRDRPASRTGEFQLASIDDQRARLVDVSRLQRTGQTIRAPLIEVSRDPPKLDRGRIHSTTFSWELDCARGTYRVVEAHLRTIGTDQLPHLGAIDGLDTSWKPLPALGRVQPLVCERKPLPGTLTWTDLDAAEKALRGIFGQGLAEKKNGVSELATSQGTQPASLGTTVKGSLASWNSDIPLTFRHVGYAFDVKAGERFEVEVTARFHPYLRVRTDSYLESSYDVMAEGAATPVGAHVVNYRDTKVVVEVGALEEPADPAFELTLRRLPGESGVPRDPARIGRVDLERLIAESAQGRAAKSSLDSTRAAAQQRVDAEKTALRQNPNDPARRQALEKQLIRYETTMKSEERRWHERLLELFGERAAALAWKLDLDLVVSGDQPALKGVPVQDLTAAVMDGPVEPLKPYAGSAQVRIFYFDEETAALTGGSWAAVEARAKPYTLIRGSSVVWSRSGYDVTYERKETPGR